VPDNTLYGPTNPHPLSTRRTELVWEGKYDDFGNRREVDVAGMAMPLQKIETVDEPRSRSEGQGALFDHEKAHRDDFRNMLVWGDNKLVMASLLKDFRGKVDLIYIDPPFDVGADFTMAIPLGDEDDVVEKDQSTLEMVAYRDMWGKGTDSYLHMLYERIILMKELLADEGSIYVHVGPTVGSLVKLLLDEIFAVGNFRNNVRWRRMSISGFKGKQKIPFNHETIYYYTKGSAFTFNAKYADYSEEYKSRFRYIDEQGRRYRADQNLGTATTEAKITEMMEAGLVHVGEKGRRYRKQFLDELPGVSLDDVWTDVPWVTAGDQRIDFPTQKPEALLQRIIELSSNEDDLVADFFCGSGTTGAVAERLGRRWIMADLGRFAIHTTRKRLIDLQRKLHANRRPYRAFDVYNLGRYERQWWQQERLKGADAEHRRVVLNFFKAEPLTASPAPSLHGKKGPAFVHVDAIDTLLTRDELRNVVKDAAAAGATEVVCLSWEFEMDLKLVADALQQEFGVKARLYLIPREIMERNRATPPPFFEVATLKAEAFTRNISGKKVWDIRLTDFLPSLAEVPNKEIEALKERAIENGFDFIDFWAVDFDFRHGEPFHHDWQAYRTRKSRKLPIESDLGFELNGKKSRTACVKVVDIFGCDTSITVEVPA